MYCLTSCGSAGVVVVSTAAAGGSAAPAPAACLTSATAVCLLSSAAFPEAVSTLLAPLPAAAVPAADGDVGDVPVDWFAGCIFPMYCFMLADIRCNTCKDENKQQSKHAVGP